MLHAQASLIRGLALPIHLAGRGWIEAVDVVLASEGTLLVGEQALVPSLRRDRAVRREQDAHRKQHAVAAFDPPTASL